MPEINPLSLKDARINDVFVEAPHRIVLHLRDGRAIAIWADYDNDLNYELVNP